MDSRRPGWAGNGQSLPFNGHSDCFCAITGTTCLGPQPKNAGPSNPFIRDTRQNGPLPFTGDPPTTLFAGTPAYAPDNPTVIRPRGLVRPRVW